MEIKRECQDERDNYERNDRLGFFFVGILSKKNLVFEFLNGRT